ncbi:ultraviolet-B receptor UVR8-like [Amborella trichopoda]|nr:ultraviolet-B receptor UVR8-like [Amborella trichopoda]|eukprot:XP_020530583.1 ultraviolet-B receptor UVR8-like [Amborella trichopoda]
MEVTASNTVPRSLQFDEDDFPSASSLYPNSTLVFAWGRGDYGQLGLGDDAGRDFPTCIQSLSDKSIVHVSGNDFHTAFLTGEGDLFMTGNNDSGQLGVRSRESQLSSMRVSSLDIYRISHVACGQAHTVAVTDMGAVVSWGASEFGQLGHKDAIDVVDVIQPRIVKGTRDLHFVRVACGAAHTLALTGSGEVYSFGQGLYGALGLGSIESTSSPTLVNDLWGLGIIQITCGENHSAALSVDGQVFTWGRGKYGQLGHGTLQNELRPLPVKLLADQMIVQLICGGNHTMAINEEGMLFSWGQGHWGQTGLGVVEDTLLPTQVHCLQGLRIIQASAGSRHSIAVTDDGKVYGWGDGEQNQLGFTTNKIQMLPSLLSFPVKEGLQLLYALAAGEHTIAVFCHLQRDQLRFSGPSNLDCSKHDVVAFELNKGDIFGTDLWSHGYQIAEQELVLSEENDPCILPGDSYVDIPGSGFKPMIIPYLPKLLEEGNCSLRSLAILVQSIEDIFSSIRFLTLSFKLHPSRWFGKGILKARSLMETDSDGPGLDTLLIRDVYQKILELYRPEILNKLVGSLIRCLEGIEKHKYDVSDSRWTRSRGCTLYQIIYHF